MKRKFVGLFLVLAMVVGCLPNVVWATDYSASRIVNYVNGRVGESYAYGYCLRFVEECYQNIYGFRAWTCCAYKSGSLYIDSTSRDIPLGATVYFGGSSVSCGTCGNKAGHVGIYVGNGYFVHDWDGKVQKTTIDYIVSRGYPYRGWGWMCNTALTSGATTPPTNSRLSVNKQNVAANETFTLSYSAINATNYRIGYYWSGDNGLHVIEKGAATSADLKFSQPGKYTIHVQCINAFGSIDTNTIAITVYNSAPNNARISANKQNVAVNEAFTLSYSATNATNYRIGYYWSGDNVLHIIEKGTSTSESLKFSQPGEYKIHVQCTNTFGSIDTSTITVVVKDNSIYPFTVSKNYSYATITNNTSEKRKACVIVAKYSGGIFLNSDIYDTVYIAPETPFKINTNSSDYKVFVWDSLESMKPLAK